MGSKDINTVSGTFGGTMDYKRNEESTIWNARVHVGLVRLMGMLYVNHQRCYCTVHWSGCRWDSLGAML